MAAEKPIVCEYFIQNSEADPYMNQTPFYPNIFILPKKYLSISDVRVQDIYKAFPLKFEDTTHHYILRFETILQISSSKKLSVWMDVNPDSDISVPHKNGSIRVKVLKLPRGIKPKVVQKPRQP